VILCRRFSALQKAQANEGKVWNGLKRKDMRRHGAFSLYWDSNAFVLADVTVEVDFLRLMECWIRSTQRRALGDLRIQH